MSTDSIFLHKKVEERNLKTYTPEGYEYISLGYKQARYLDVVHSKNPYNSPKKG